MQLLYINADFDENCLETKIYKSIDDDSFKLSGITISRNKGELSELE